MLGAPAEFALDACRTRNQHRRVARPARRLPFGYRPPGDAHRGVDHFPDRVTVPAASQVVGAAHARVPERRHREDVRARQILHVNVVPDAGTIGSGVIVPENGDVRQRACRYAEDQRNEMGFRIVSLPVRRGRSRGVEVTKADRADAVGPRVSAQAALECQFCFAIRVRRLRRIVFIDPLPGRLAVDRGGGREHQTPDTAVPHRIQ